MTQLETPQLTPLQTTEIPGNVLEAFNVTAERIKALGGGLVNCTYLVEGVDETVIVQKLSDVIQTELIYDADVYCRHLKQADWESPEPRKTSEGLPFHRDDDERIWRVLNYIDSDESAPAEISHKTLEAIGSMIAHWHRTMSWLDYQPTFGIPHFHDTAYYAQELLDNLPNLPSSESVNLADKVLRAYEGLPPLPSAPQQLIHGDPKLNNMLFRNGKPLTLIDLDTVMRGPVWLDIGDALRSQLASDIIAGRTLDTGKIESMAEGYFNASRPGIRFRNFIASSALATKHITLELAMRYLNDIQDDEYFSWDSSKYSSRHDNHLVRAGLQWQLFSELES